MFSSFVAVLALTLSAGQDAGPEIVNPRATFGYLGSPRPKGAGMLPGDIAYVSFEIKNLKLDAKGKAAYSIAIGITDDAGKVLFEQKPHNAVSQNFFGGDLTPAAAQIQIPFDSKPGAANWKITVKDRTSGQSTSLAGAGKILPAAFGLVQVGTYADPEAHVPVPPVGVLGGTLYVNFGVVGFKHAARTGNPDVEVSLRVLDAKGQPTFKMPLTGRFQQEIPKDVQALPMQFGLTMNRVGSFTIELSARDTIGGETATVTLPLRILALE